MIGINGKIYFFSLKKMFFFRTQNHFSMNKKKCGKGRIVQALYATLSWACCCFFVEGGALYQENRLVGPNFFIWMGGIK